MISVKKVEVEPFLEITELFEIANWSHDYLCDMAIDP